MKTKTKNKMRKSTKYVTIVVSIIVLIFSFINFITTIQKENMKTFTKEIYKYTNKFNYDYKINLISNKYMTNDEIKDKNLAYVTDLIDNIKLNLNYDYTASKNSEIKCTYSIVGLMQAVYTRNGEEQKIWEKEETLLKEKTTDSASDNIQIAENLKLDLKDKNELINNFKQQLGMSIDAKYTVKLKIKVSTQVEGKEIEDELTPFINIDLAEKTTKISGENNIENSEYISKEYNITEKSSTLALFIDIVLIIVAIFVLRYVSKFKIANVVRNEYKYELNRILKICQDKIVQVSTRPNDEEIEVVYVKDFGEIFKVSEELFKPILYYNAKENEEAWFSVMSGKTSYRFVLKK